MRARVVSPFEEEVGKQHHPKDGGGESSTTQEVKKRDETSTSPKEEGDNAVLFERKIQKKQTRERV